MNKEDCLALFRIAGFTVSGIWELANQYWPRPQFEEGRGSESLRYAKLREQSPWWLVKTEFGLVEIGWRKRCIEIRWGDFSYHPEVTSDDVTKSDTYVHAWTTMKAAEYLAELKKRCDILKLLDTAREALHSAS